MHTLKSLAHAISATYMGDDVPFAPFSIDTRTLAPGDIFCAIEGSRVNGHDFIDQAIEKGASAIVTERPLTLSVPTMIVSDTTQAMADLTHAWRQQFKIPIIAITGSCGKTTTKNILFSILSHVGNTLCSPGNYNSAYGMPISLSYLNDTHQFGVFELGTTSKGEIKHLTDCLSPTVTTVLNVRVSHLDGAGSLGSIDGVSKEKSDIFLGLSGPRVALINLDEPCHTQWNNKLEGCSLLSYSLNTKADVYADNIKVTTKGAVFDCHTTLGKRRLTVPLLGEYVISNVLAAISAALSVGAQLDDVEQGLATLTPEPGRLEPKQLPCGACLIDDTYNGICAAVKEAIKTLGMFEGRRICVLHHMTELGDYSEEYHRDVGKWAKENGIHHLLLTGDEATLKPMLSSAGSIANFFPALDPLYDCLERLLDDKTTVLVKGPRVSKMERLVERLTTHDAILTK